MKSVPEDKNLLVFTASAGSGKTFTLVREYLKLCLKGDNPQYFKRILAITFTRKAAAEMKERVIATLTLLAREKTDAESGSLLKLYSDYLGLEPHVIRARSGTVLKNMLHNYADLSISTIDRFVQKLIRSFTRDLNLPVDFEVLLEHEDFLKETIDRLINEVGMNAELSQTLIDFLKSLLEEERNWDLRKDLLGFSQIIFREDSHEPIEQIRHISAEQFKMIRKRLSDKVYSAKQQLKSVAEEVITRISQSGLKTDDFAYGKSGAVGMFYKLTEANGDFTQVKPGVRFNEVVIKNNWLPAKADSALKAKAESILPELQRAHQLITAVYQRPGIFLEAILLHQLYNLTLLHDINTRLLELKEERNVLFIEDFNRLIADIVINEPAPFIYEKTGEWFAHILIDEFQDTSVMQWQNFIPLIENAMANGTSCMLVGDGKQAIYRFRSGEVEQLAVLPALFGADKNEWLAEKQWLFSSNFFSVPLETNFRSQKAIVEFNNHFFTKFYENFNHQLKKVYENNQQKVLQEKQGGYVEWCNVPEKSGDRIEMQLNTTLEYIHQCREDGFDWRDITCLVRGRKEGNVLAEFLNHQGIDVISPDSLLVGSSVEVRLIMSLIQFVQNDKQEEIKGKIMEYIHTLQGEPEKTLQSIRSFRSEKGLIRLRDFFAAHGFVWNTGWLEKLPLYQLAEQFTSQFLKNKSDIFVNALLEQIHQFVQQNGSRADFIEWWLQTGSEQAVQVSAETNAIQVMTIHKSKGLQFPVVILPFADWQIKTTKTELWVDIHEEELGIDRALIKVSEERMSQINRQKEFAEERDKTFLDHINLLYVAFTRPEERLYFITSDVAGSRISKYIKEYAAGCLTVPEGENKCFIGKRDRYKSGKPVSENELYIRTKFSTNWREKIRISYEATKAWGESGVFESARHGNLVHLVLGKLQNVNQLEEVLQELYELGECSSDDLPLLKEELQHIFEHDFIRSVFDSENSRAEAEIVDQSGEIHRPDRLIFEKDRVRIIDFKTGKAHPSHESQMQRYGNLLSAMGYEIVEKYLFYTANKELIQIS